MAMAFQKLAFLEPLAPTQSEPPFVVAQLVVLATFVVLGIVAVRSYRSEVNRLTRNPMSASKVWLTLF